MLRSKSIAIAIALFLPTIASAKVWYVAPTASGTGDCSGWGNACNSLATAVSKITLDEDEIWVKAGAYKFTAEVTNKLKSSTPTNTYYPMKIYGGFAGTETSSAFRDPVKNVVIFTAHPSLLTVIPSYTSAGAAGSRILRFDGTGVKDTSEINILDGVTITGIHLQGANYGGVLVNNAKAEMDKVKFIGNKGHGAALYLNGAFSSAVLTNMEFTNNQAIDDAAGSGSEVNSGGAIYAAGANASLNCDACKFTGNVAVGNGGAVNADTGVKVTITNSSFETNSTSGNTGKGGGIYIKGPGPYFSIASTLFNANTTPTAAGTAGGGGGVYLDSTVGEILSCTFFDNRVHALGGAIAVNNSQLNLQYSTLYKNLTTTAVSGLAGVGAGIAVWPDAASLNLKANILMNNYNNVTGVSAQQNIHRLKTTTNPVITDSGFNLISFGTTGVGLSEGGTGYSPAASTAITFASLFPDAATTNTINPTAVATVDKIIETSLLDNGGNAKSLKLAVGSIAIDVIDNDLPVGGVGTTPSNPFTSIAQARGVMASYSSYDAGRYYFNLTGTTFATYVDKDGYVLVASASTQSVSPAPYTEVTVLAERSDNILDRSILAKFTTAQIDEVRISVLSDGDRGTFDMFSKDPDVINSLKSFAVLNNSNNGGSWTVKSSSLAIDYSAGASCPPGNGGAPDTYSLKYSIFHACGNGSSLHWIPNTSREALIDSAVTTVKDELDLWVRSSQGNCNGTVPVDQRGLPRADYVNPNDPNQYGEIHDCDIGGFEWNNGYQLDCWNEDGSRPENNLSGGIASVCFSDPNSLTPKGLIDNFGYIHWQSLLMLMLLGIFRKSRKVDQIAC